MRLQGKRILISGTGGGEGKAAQALFEREGARVIGCDVQPGKADYSVDLTDPDAARRWIDESAEQLGGVDVLYNNAAGYGFSRRTVVTSSSSPRTSRPRSRFGCRADHL